MRKLFFLLTFLPGLLLAQKKAPFHSSLTTAACSAPGTIPSKAIPVCGTTVFTQNDITDCTAPDVAQNLCPDLFTSGHSFWYKFTCFTSGTLEFLIDPNVNDDYDWVLFDVTGHNPDDVLTDPSLVISINGAFPTGLVTGCAPAGTSNVNCFNSADVLNKPENILAGHNFLLMVTNFTNTPPPNNGYNLSFGGTAVISDGNLPDIDHIVAGCNSIKVFFTTDIKCNSVTGSGSEFVVGPGTNTITGVTSDCPLGFLAINSLTINLASPLVQGNYTLTIKKGTDNNTFRNICDNEIPVGTVVNFSIQRPVANFILPPEACLGDARTFTSSSDPLPGNTVTEWHWNFGDATTSLLQNPSHTYAAAGTYLVKHWIVNSLGCNSDTSVQSFTVNSLPTANFNFAIPGCATRDISFSDISIPNSGTLTNWAWDFGDGNTSALQNPIHSYAAAGTYNVKLTVTSSKGCINNIIKQVVINHRPAAGFILPAVCLNDTYAQFTDNSTVAAGNITNWDWNFGDPGSGLLNVSPQQNPQHSYSAVGPYNVRLIVTSNNGCRDTITQTIFVNGSFPTADFNVQNAAGLCANDSVAIVEASTVFPGNITKVQIWWDNINFPGGLPQVDNNPFPGKVYKHLYLPNSQVTKTYQVRYQAFSGGVCEDDKLQIITVNAAPLVQFNNIPDTCLLVAPFQVTQASEIGGVPGTGIYSGPGISASGIFDPAIAGVGTHTIKYTFTSVMGCVDMQSRSITVTDTASARFSFTSPTCDGNAVNFKDESVAPAGVNLSNVTWNFGDGSPAEVHLPGASVSHVFPAWGDYTVTLFNTSVAGCLSTVTSKRVHINPQPVTDFAFLQSSVCLPNALVSFANNSSIADASALLYTWDFGDGSPFSSAFAPSHIYTGTGPYLVRLTARSNVGCTRTFTRNVDFIHPQPHANFTTSKPSACLGEVITFTDITDPLDGITTEWHWSMGDGSVPNTRTFSYTYIDTLEYNTSLFIVNSQGCHSDTINKLFKVYPNPTVNAGEDRLVLQGGRIILNPTAEGVQLQYLWTPVTYLLNGVDNIKAPTAIRIMDDITYTLTVTARGGCKRSDDMFIKVLKPPVIPNTFTPNNDGINDKWVITYLNDYPDCRVEVFTRTGQLVFSSAKGYPNPWNGTRNGKPLPFDTYYYILEPGFGREPITGYVTLVK